MNEDPDKVKKIDQTIRENIPEFSKAKKVGYLFASNEEGRDNVWTEEDGLRVYNQILSIFNQN